MLAAVISQDFRNVATGGTVTTATIGGKKYRLHKFTGSGTLTVSRGLIPFRVLCVGAGAGGAYLTGGGRGALTDNASATLAAGARTVTVGTGGAGRNGYAYGNGAPYTGGNGGASSVDGTVSAAGGVSGGGTQAVGTSSDITGTSVQYGGAGAAATLNAYPDSATGYAVGGGNVANGAGGGSADGTFPGAGGCGAQIIQAGSGFRGEVIVRYEVLG